MSIVGLDIGGTKTAIVVGDSGGRILSRHHFATNTARGFDPVFSDICAGARVALESQSEPAVAMSVSIGGPLDVLNGIIKS